MTLVASTNVLMSSVHRRWLTKREIMTIQGFPVNSMHTFGVPCSSYALREWMTRHGLSTTSWPSRRAACEQSGNSMHTAVSGIVFLYTLTQVIMNPNMMWLQWNSVQRVCVGLMTRSTDDQEVDVLPGRHDSVQHTSDANSDSDTRPSKKPRVQ